MSWTQAGPHQADGHGLGEGGGGKAPRYCSVAQSESTGSDLLVFPFWSSFSHGPKKVNLLFLGPLGK